MLRKRPCRICRKWFTPHRRAGDRQHVCSSEVCQTERHRRNCKVINRANRDNDQAHRFLQKLQTIPPAKSESSNNCRGPTPDKQICWPVAQKAVGVKVAALVETSIRNIQTWVQDPVRLQL